MKSENITIISPKDLSLLKKIRAKRFPFSFDLEITARCNNNCLHCYNNLPANNKMAIERELSFGKMTEIINEASSLGSIMCLITGGEPLLRKDFDDIYLYLKKRGLLVSVFTNATLISEKHVQLFKKYPPRSIEITVYGVTKETYEKISRRSGSYEAFLRGLTMLRDGGIRVSLKTMVMRSNVHEFKRIAKFCKENTCDFFRFDPFLHLRFDKNSLRNEEIKSERLDAETIISLEREDPVRSKLIKKECSKIRNSELYYVNNGKLFLCGAGNNGFSISYDGFFRLCATLGHPRTIYNLKEGTLSDAWHNFVPKVRKFFSKRKEYLEKCLCCPIKNICFWCPAHAYLESGQLDKHIKYFCNIAQARARSAMSD